MEARALLRDKKGMSVIIGYVLLVVAGLVMGSLVYVWMKTYVPQEEIECPEGISIYIKEANCYLDNGQTKLNLTLKNSGRFSLGGFYIHATNKVTQEIASRNLVEFVADSSKKFSDSLRFESAASIALDELNTFAPNEEANFLFNLNEEIFSIEIKPTRHQEIDQRVRFVSCSAAKVKETIKCE